MSPDSQSHQGWMCLIAINSRAVHSREGSRKQGPGQSVLGHLGGGDWHFLSFMHDGWSSVLFKGLKGARTAVRVGTPWNTLLMTEIT